MSLLYSICKNCGRSFGNHSAYNNACNEIDADIDPNLLDSCLMWRENTDLFDVIDLTEPNVIVYINKSRDKSKAIPIGLEEKDKSDTWQAWAHNKPGECPCGIKRNLCDYHKE